MTTTVTVQTHSWPAEVSSFALNDRKPSDDAEWTKIGEVPPNSSGAFVVHSGQDIMVRELPSETELAAAETAAG